MTLLRFLNSSSGFLPFAILEEIGRDPPPVQHEMKGNQQYQEDAPTDMQAHWHDFIWLS